MRGRRGADLAVDRSAADRMREQLAPGGEPLVVNVGRHERQKGQDLLLTGSV